MAPPPDPDAIQEFANDTVARLAAAWTTVATHIGDRLGLYQSLAEGTGTAEDIAHRASTHPRLTEEWLNGQVAAGIVELDDGRYRLPAAHAAVLADEQSPAFLGAAGGVLAAVHRAEHDIVEAFRGDGKLAWAEQAPCLATAVDRFYRTGYEAALVDEWIPLLANADEDLRNGGRVADVGCGQGTALLLLAQAYPTATFVGIDSHEESLARGRDRAIAADVGDRVEFRRGDAAHFEGGPYDLVCVFDALHDMGDPATVIRRIRDQLSTTGSVLLVEPSATETVEESVGQLPAQLYYPGSAFLCTPHALTQGDTALGNQVPEARWRDQFHRAGFTSFQRVAASPFNRIFEARP